ncbi:ABC transporter ATP-binding protein [bacterium]|nr:ABC transporter ATP-binding protein [bacterium]MBU3955789.1 ABC transporter ATP-binding protein [bacterium]
MKLKVLNLSFSYDTMPALEEISFEAEAGEILGVIGPNGSGKTTLLKCINMKLKPLTGTVLADDKNISKLPRREIAKYIGVVPQISSISFPFTVFEVVLMGRYSYQKRFRQTKEKEASIVRRCLEITGVKDLSARFITEISGGEYQRVIIARALAQEPKALLLDEPTLHLDINHQIEILDLIFNLAKKKKLAVVMVLHDLNLAARYSDRIIALNKGRIFDSGTPEKVISMENINKIYGIDVEINRNNKGSHLNIIPLSAREKYE